MEHAVGVESKVGEMRKVSVVVMALALLAAVAYFVWPSPWAYSSLQLYEKGAGHSSVPVELRYRTNRFTGRKQVYTIVGTGWDWTDLPAGG